MPSVSRRCVVVDCPKPFPKKSMFAFPVDDIKRCKLWLKALGLKHLLTLSKGNLKKEFVCEDHFSTSVDESLRQKTLRFNSVPEMKLPKAVLSDKDVAAWPPADMKLLQTVDAESKGSKEVLDNFALNKDVPMSPAPESAIVSLDSAKEAGETSSIYRESGTAVTFQYSDVFSTNGESNSSTESSFSGLPCLDNCPASETNSISSELGAAVTFQYSDVFSTSDNSQSSTENSFSSLPSLNNCTAGKTNTLSSNLGAAVTFQYSEILSTSGVVQIEGCNDISMYFSPQNC